MAHTPGPWTFETVKTSCGLCHKIGPFPWKPGATNHACIYDDYPRPGGTPELIASARLIAAAPDLLSALELVRHHADDEAGFMVDVRKAIAKARGEKG